MKTTTLLITLQGMIIPAAPTLTAPSSVTSDTTPDITVNAVTGAATYQFQVSTVSNFASTVADATQAGTTYTVAPALSVFTTYYARVRGLNAGGVAGAWSSTLTFAVEIYLFRDLFTDTVAAGAYHNTASAPGAGTRTATDTESKLSGDGLKMVCAGGKATPAFGDPVLVENPTVALARAAGVVLRYKFTPHNVVTSSGCFHGLSNAQLATIALTTFPNHGYRFQGSGGQIVFNDGSGNRLIGMYAADQEYTPSIVLRGTGAFLLIRGGAYGSTYDTLLYPCNAGTDTPLYPAFYNANMVFDVDAVDVIDLTSTAWSNANGLATAAVASASAGEEITTNRDSFIEFTWTPQAAQTLEFSFRYAGAGDRWYLSCDQAGGTIKLYYVEASGTPVEVQAGQTQTWTVGTPYRIVIVDGYKDIRTFVANVPKHTVDTNPAVNNVKFITGTYKAKVSLAGANLITHPKYSQVLTGAVVTRNIFERAYAKNAAAALNIVFPDTSTEGVHPDVVDAGAGGWNGHRYWMAVTGYQNADSNDENPCIFASDDKTTWVVPDGLTNPIEADPAVGFNSDPDLTLVGSTLWCVWRFSNGTSETIYARSSTDGVDWTNKVTLFTTAFGDAALSPAIVYDNVNNLYRCFTVSQRDSYILQMRTCATINGTWSAPQTVTCTPPAGDNLWHHDIIRDGSRLWMMAHIQGATNGLYLAYSDDWGGTWTVQTEPFMTRNLFDAAAWDRTSIYRGTVLKTATGFDMWYSGYRDNAGTQVWGIAYAPVVFTDSV